MTEASMPARLRNASVVSAMLVLWTGHAAAQSRAVACRPVPASRGAAIVYAREGGNIRPFTISLSSSGAVTFTGPVAPAAKVDSAEVAAIARLARTSRFWKLPANATRVPTRNPDEARISIRVRTTCGTHSSAYPQSTAPRAFLDLASRLAALTGVSP